MATEFALVPENAFWLKADGTLASGYQLFIYTAGSSTKATTHKDSDGAVANTNPIVLDSLGQTPHGVYVASGTYKTVLASDTDTDPPATAIRTRDNITPRNDTTTTQSEWVASGLTPTFTSSTTFTLVGDQTSLFHVGRRLKTTDSSGTDYSTITVTAFTTLTTVTIGTANLDSGLSAVSYSLLSAANSSTPFVSSTTTGLTVTSSLTLTQGTDVASATDLLVNIPGNLFDITGTTTIATLATKGIGTHVTLQFDGALTLTHSAANLILPGGVDITTAAGDIAVFYEYASADWRCVSFVRASGKGVLPLTVGTLTDITSGSPTDVVFSGIPSWATNIIFSFQAMSLSGSSDPGLQLGDAGGIEESGYVAGCTNGDGSSTTTSTAMFPLHVAVAADSIHGVIHLTLMDASTNLWAASGTSYEDGSAVHTIAGTKALSATATQLNLTSVNGTDTFDGGQATATYW